MELLAARLRKALRLPERDEPDWARCLWALAEPASKGAWNNEMRLLSDLQKACLDNERPLYAADLVEWLLSGFRRPVKRPLPDLPPVLTVKHLRQAQARLPAARLADEDRRRLGNLLSSALGDAEARLRDLFRPRLHEALDAVGLNPASAAEGLARDKLVEELLDGVVQRGYLTLGDLRDALARNRLKLPDLAGPGEFISGDPLLRLDRRLADDLDGVYRQGEAYLRWLQRLSSVFFGTRVGRFLTLYLILPLLGSLFILMGIDGIAAELNRFVVRPLLRAASARGEVAEAVARDVEGHGSHEVVHTFNAWSFPLFALFLLFLIHSRPFRRGVLLGLWYVWLGVRGVLYDLPAAFFRLEAVRRFLQSPAYLRFYQFVARPIVLTLPVAVALRLGHVGWGWTLLVWGGLAVAVSAVSNTRVGLLVEETAADWTVRTWELVRDDLVPGLFRWIMWLSRRLQQRVEKVSYTVEEWLLFRQGQSRLIFALKLVLGVPWFVVSYVFRFAIIVLIEPQINPIKHFPVVTVSHKLMLLAATLIAGPLAPYFGWSDPKAFAFAVVIPVLSLIPGLFGFLAWELKENWKLYRANGSPVLEPEMIGSHGERLINFVRPGFHSGTLPKLFARLRRAKGAAERRNEEGLHHAEEDLRRFVQRELLAPLASSKSWPLSATTAVGHVRLATNRILIELCCPGAGPDGAWLEFANRGGRLVARFAAAGWVAGLPEVARGVLVTALTGFYERAGVDLAGEQLDAALPPGSEYEVAGGKLYVRPAGEQAPVVYDLAEPELPADAGRLVFCARPVTWQAWVERWQLDQLGEPHEPPLLSGVRLLPA
jgi:hypothetical protein